jgi:transcriptional regulator with XRE-family HTH domain
MNKRREKQIKEYFGMNVRRFREQLGMTQGELAEKVGLGRTSITNIELGIQTTTVVRAAAIAAALRRSGLWEFVS